MHGKISVDSRVDHGAVFTITFPPASEDQP
jgi:signal transduction histidine kinase